MPRSHLCGTRSNTVFTRVDVNVTRSRYDDSLTYDSTDVLVHMRLCAANDAATWSFDVSVRPL
jgi:hypothetical protein